MQQSILLLLVASALLFFMAIVAAHVRRRRRKTANNTSDPKMRKEQKAKDGKFAERFVSQHCDATFLRLWGIANPIGKDQQKELCDYLVVCDPDIIIVSVRDITLSDAANAIERERWRRKAIKKSAESIYGAERILRTLDQVRHTIGPRSKASGRSQSTNSPNLRCLWSQTRDSYLHRQFW
jgi:hypothetical protein